MIRAGQSREPRPRPTPRATRSPGGSAPTLSITAREFRLAVDRRPGWLLVCSDGLWNYASVDRRAGHAVHGLRVSVGTDPVPLAPSARRLGERREAGTTTSRWHWLAASRHYPESGASNRRRHMHVAEFKAEVFQNEYLSEGATDVHAVVSVTCSGAGMAGQAAGPRQPRSSSSTRRARWTCRPPRSPPRGAAAKVAVDEIVDGTWFAVDQLATPSRRWCTRRTRAWPR